MHCIIYIFITCGALMHCIIYIFKYYLWQMSILGSAWVLFTRVFFFLDHHHARRRQWRWARYVFLMIHYWLLTMTAQHRMTKAHPLACNCKPGWVSTFFLPTWTHPLACNCETGWVFFLLFCRSTNDDDDDEPCRLAVVICLCLHPRQRRQPTPSLAIARRGGFFHLFFQVNECQRWRRAM